MSSGAPKTPSPAKQPKRGESFATTDRDCEPPNALASDIAQAETQPDESGGSGSEAPLPVKIGPYHILGRLGGGGMGVVYRAVLEGAEQIVALKTILVPRATHVAAIRREVHALARVRHPAVVRIAATGLEDGLPWYAMELVDGVALRRHPVFNWRTALSIDQPELHAAQPRGMPWWTSTLSSDIGTASGDMEEVTTGSGRVTAADGSFMPLVAGGRLDRALSITRDLCHALAYLHGEGLIHGDLKPENIIIRPDGSPVLVDFGLMSRFGGAGSRDALIARRLRAGTVHYMAPEQIQGGHADPRTDLYAMGCMLYEWLCGRRPFPGDTNADILRGHLELTPTPPSSLVRDLPPELDGLIMRLLERDAAARFGHATDVAEAISAIGGLGPTSSDIPARPYLYPPRLQGRSDTMARFWDALDKPLALRPGLVLMRGESGSGKTRLLEELTGVAARLGYRVLLGECDARNAVRRGARPLHALRMPLQTLVDRCREGGAERAGRVLPDATAGLLLPYAPGLATLPGVDTSPPPPARSLSQGRERLLDALSGAFSRLAGERPLLLVLDDVHWADRSTLAFLERAARVGVDGVTVVAAYRAEEDNDALIALAATPGVILEYLERLDLDAVGRMVGDMLALHPAPRVLVDYVTRKAGGNPFFVAEYMRTALAEALLHRQAGIWRVSQVGNDGGRPSLPLPDRIRELAVRRMAHLSPVALRLLEVCAVVGRECEWELLKAAGQVDDQELLDGLQLLTAAQLLEESKPGSFRFVHGQLREAAYERLAHDVRRNRHREVAETIEARWLEPTARTTAREWVTEGATSPLHHLVGREAELALCVGRMESTRHDESSVILVEGGAGTGKSTLVSAALERARNLDVRILVGAADPRQSATPYYPWRTIFRGLFGLDSDTNATAVVQQALAATRLDADLQRLRPLLNPVLGTQFEDNTDTLMLTGPARGSQLGRLLVGLLQLHVRAKPLVIMLEDMHWADSASWALAAQVSEQVKPVVLYLVMRPPRARLHMHHERLMATPRAFQLILGGLSRARTEELVRMELMGSPVAAEVVDWVLAASEGTPFFILELIRSTRESGGLTLSANGYHFSGDVPAAEPSANQSLETVLNNRIGRLEPDTRRVLESAAVVGPVFTAEQVRQTSGEQWTRDEVESRLGRLEAAGLIATLVASGGFRFAHALTRDAAYQLLDNEARRPLHRRTAEGLESSTMASLPVLAHHWRRAGEGIRAVDYYERAGDLALRTGADAEAEALFGDALDTCAELEDGQTALLRPRRAVWERKRGEAQFRLGDLPGCRARQVKALILLDRPFPNREWRHAARILYELARRLVRRVLPGRARVATEAERADLLGASKAVRLLGNVDYFTDNSVSMVTATLMSLNLAEAAGPSVQLARELASYALMTGIFGLRRTAEHSFDRAERMLEELDDVAARMWLRQVHAIYRLGEGEWRRGLELAIEGRALADQLSDRYGAEVMTALEALGGNVSGRFPGWTRDFRPTTPQRSRALQCTTRGVGAVWTGPVPRTPGSTGRRDRASRRCPGQAVAPARRGVGDHRQWRVGPSAVDDGTSRPRDHGGAPNQRAHRQEFPARLLHAGRLCGPDRSLHLGLGALRTRGRTIPTSCAPRAQANGSLCSTFRHRQAATTAAAWTPGASAWAAAQSTEVVATGVGRGRPAEHGLRRAPGGARAQR